MPNVSDLMNIPVLDSASMVPNAQEERGYEQRDRTIDPEGGFAKPYTGPVFTRQEIIDRALEKEAKKQRNFDILALAKVPPLHQSSTNYCWGNCACDAVQVRRVLSGSPHVPLSAASVCAPVKNYSNVGGWPLQALKYGAEHGWAPVANWPANAINRKYDTAESRAARKPFKVAADGWLDLPPNEWLVVFTRLVLGDPVTLCHMEWSHAVLGIDVVVLPGKQLGALCRNSGYGRDNTGHSIIKESFGLPDDALAIQVVTAT